MSRKRCKIKHLRSRVPKHEVKHTLQNAFFTNVAEMLRFCFRFRFLVSVPVSGSRFPVPVSRFGVRFPVLVPVSGFRFPVPVSRFPVRFPVSGFGSGFRFPVSGSGFPVWCPVSCSGSGFRFPVSGSGFAVSCPVSGSGFGSCFRFPVSGRPRLVLLRVLALLISNVGFYLVFLDFLSKFFFLMFHCDSAVLHFVFFRCGSVAARSENCVFTLCFETLARKCWILQCIFAFFENCK